MTKLEVLFILSFASMDGDSAHPETVLFHGQAISAPSLSAGPAATGSPAASAPMLAELKSFLSHELFSFKEELKSRTMIPPTLPLRKFV